MIVWNISNVRMKDLQKEIETNGHKDFTFHIKNKPLDKESKESLTLAVADTQHIANKDELIPLI